MVFPSRENSGWLTLKALCLPNPNITCPVHISLPGQQNASKRRVVTRYSFRAPLHTAGPGGSVEARRQYYSADVHRRAGCSKVRQTSQKGRQARICDVTHPRLGGSTSVRAENALDSTPCSRSGGGTPQPVLTAPKAGMLSNAIAPFGPTAMSMASGFCGSRSRRGTSHAPARKLSHSNHLTIRYSSQWRTRLPRLSVTVRAEA